MEPLKSKENKGNGEIEANVCEPAMKNEAYEISRGNEMKNKNEGVE